jgi:hypothetical protein
MDTKHCIDQEPVPVSTYYSPAGRRGPNNAINHRSFVIYLLRGLEALGLELGLVTPFFHSLNLVLPILVL